MPKQTQPTRKVYMFIVEGWSDDTAIVSIIRKLYRNRTIYSVVMQGDITSDLNTDISRIVRCITQKVKDKLNEEKIRTSDVLHIFHICDMDGAFVPDSAIVLGNGKKYSYSSTNIEVPDVNKAIKRNAHKRQAIETLLKTTTMMNISYKMFFMSSNLDHVLYNIQNLDDELKTGKADNFLDGYRNSPEKLIPFLNSVSFEVPNTYSESWKYIKQGLHSLERHNNLFICFNDYPPFAQ